MASLGLGWEQEDELAPWDSGIKVWFVLGKDKYTQCPGLELPATETHHDT